MKKWCVTDSLPATSSQITPENLDASKTFVKSRGSSGLFFRGFCCYFPGAMWRVVDLWLQMFPCPIDITSEGLVFLDGIF